MCGIISDLTRVYPDGTKAHILVINMGVGSVRECTLDKPANELSRRGLATAAAPLPSGLAARGFAEADLNGDGISDFVVIAQDAGQIFVYLGNADGSLQTGVPYSVGMTPVGIVVADFNGDGIPDLAVANQDSGNVSILLGSGAGAFEHAVNYSTGGSPASLAAGDFTGDGKLDLVVANDVSLVSMTGNGDGTFQSPVTVASPGGLSVAAADLNGDGKLDLAFGQYNSVTGAAPLLTLLGNGNGTFRAPFSTEAGPGNPDFLAFADFNGDGKLDLAVLHGLTSSLSVLLGKGDGTFQAPSTYLAGYSPVDFSMLDFNGDGNLDFVVDDLASGSNLQILSGNGDGTFQSPGYYPIPGITPTNVPSTNSIAVADFNGDGKPDVVATSLPGSHTEDYISVFLGQGGGQLAPGTNFSIQQSSGLPVGPAFVLTGDFNGDGKPDVAVAAQEANSVAILLGKGDGTFQPAAFYPAGNNPQYLVASDFNGDGKLDLAVANSGSFGSGSGNVSILLGNGDGSFQPPVNYNAGSHPSAIATADFNQDGNLDLAVADNGVIGTSNYGAVWILLGKGDGTFGTATSMTAGQNPVQLAAADLNGDGRPDLAVATSTDVQEGTGAVEVFLGTGGGSFQAPTPLPTFAPPVWVSITDTNGDGTLDIVAATEGDLDFLEGNGDGTFQAAVAFPGGAEPTSIALGGFNKDLAADLAVADEGGGVTVMLNQGVSVQGSLTISSAAGGVAALAPGSLASAFGTGLANGQPAPASLPWPANLGGTTVTIVDAKGVTTQAPVTYASAMQVNFLIPDSVAAGTATVTAAAGASQSVGQADLVALAPAVFTLNASNLAAADADCVSASGNQTFENVYQVSGGSIVAQPLSLGACAQTVLELFATGIDTATASSVQVSIGGVAANVSHAGPQGTYPGLDQINVTVPASLAGKGNVTVSLSAGGVAANAVNLTFQ